MTPEEYAARQAQITGSAVQQILDLLQFYLNQAVSAAQWLTVLQFIFPIVDRSRDESAEVAREFFDSQRLIHHPDAPRHDVYRPAYLFEWLVQALEPDRKYFTRPNTDRKYLADAGRRIAQQVEDAGRRQIIRAVETDTSRVVRGWARVATGKETCAFCIMLISRGPVYMAAETAGLDLSDKQAEDYFLAGEDVSDLMEEWHPGCDCKVVPVYDRKDWPGRDARYEALELWKDATREAKKEWDSMSPAERDDTTFNNRAINALRRRLERGDVSTSWAELAA